MNQPLIAFESSKHPGRLGKTFSILRVNNSRVRVLALKKAEDSDEVIVRIVELDGREARDVRIAFAAPVVAAREVNGQELPVGNASIVGGELSTSLGRFQPRTFAVKLAQPSARLSLPRSNPVELPYDLAVANRDGERLKFGFDGEGFALPAEMLPRTFDFAGVTFHLVRTTRQTPSCARTEHCDTARSAAALRACGIGGRGSECGLSCRR